MQQRLDAVFDMRLGGRAFAADAREFDARVIAELAALVDGVVEAAFEHREDFEVLRLLLEHRRFDLELAEKALDGARRIEHAADVHEFIEREARAKFRFFEVGAQVADAAERRRGKTRDAHGLGRLVETRLDVCSFVRRRDGARKLLAENRRRAVREHRADAAVF